MPSVFRFLTRHTLNRLEAGRQSLAAGDLAVSQSLLAREARDCLAGVRPLHRLLQRHGRLLGTLGFGVVLSVLAAEFALLRALGSQNLTIALSSCTTAIAAALALLTGSALTQRVEVAVEIAEDVLATLRR